MDRENEDIAWWLEISKALMRDVLRDTDRLIDALARLTPQEHADLVDAQTKKVDHALLALAQASGQAEVRVITGQLDEAVLIALLSRWGKYQQAWTLLLRRPDAGWVPRRETWRAVLLAMTPESAERTATLRARWPEASGGAALP